MITTTAFEVECRKKPCLSHENSSSNSIRERTKLRTRVENWFWNRKVNTRRSQRRLLPRKFLFVLLFSTSVVCIILVATVFKLRHNFIATEALLNENIEKQLQHQKQNEQYCVTETCVTAASHLLSNMDSTADPCDDFYRYACGRWHHSLPPDRSHYDTFSVMKDQLKDILRELLEAPIDVNDCNATINAKILYNSCMNETIIEERGAKPLLQLLDKLGAWPVLNDSFSDDWVYLIARLRQYNNDILLSQWVAPDNKNSSIYVIQLDQPELGMPSRDYYDPQSYQYKAYLSFMLNTARLLGANPLVALRDMEEVLKFETKLAYITVPNEERRNYTAIYQSFTVSELQETIPSIDWMRYLNQVLPMQIYANETLVVYALDYIKSMLEIVDETPRRTVINYILWRFIYHRTSNLDNRFIGVQQEYYRILYGTQAVSSRWKTCALYVNKNMGMAVGSLFVRSHFDENSKEEANEMIEDIKEAFLELLEEVDWMNEQTKSVAKMKVRLKADHCLHPILFDKMLTFKASEFCITFKAETMEQKIGFPEYILESGELDVEYEGLEFKVDEYFENVIKILEIGAMKDQLKLRSPVDKTEWVTSPAVVNAFYTRSKNVISFPAGVLQPPLYHPQFPRSLNYGGIGVVIGHEITHGFDDKGRQFDQFGNLKQWWNEESLEKFQTKSECMINQYNKYFMSNINMSVNGVITQGENIADNGGIKQAYRAYLKWEGRNGREHRLPGLNLTSYQLFFLNYAQIWCGVMRPEAAINSLRTSSHTPGKYRVIGTLSNFDEFAKAFHCRIGSAMNPVNKCQVW